MGDLKGLGVGLRIWSLGFLIGVWGKGLMQRLE